MRIWYLLLSFLFVNVLLAQEEKLQGYVTDSVGKLEGVTVFNKTKKIGTTTDSNGKFIVPISVHDSLLFSYVGRQNVIVLVDEQLLKTDTITIVLPVKDINLQEVAVIGVKLSDKPYMVMHGKAITREEHQLEAATYFPKLSYLLLENSAIPLDFLINAISGKTKRLKRNVALSEDKAQLHKLQEQYQDYLLQTLAVPQEQLLLFLYYLVDNDMHVDVLESDKALAEFKLIELYAKFKSEILSSE